MAKALTAQGVERMKADATKRTETPDSGMTGLYLVIQPSGKKSWCFRYHRGGRTRKYTIGGYPAFGLKDARSAASAAARKVTEGGDPAADKKAARKAAQDNSNDFAHAYEAYFELHSCLKNWKPSYRDEAMRLFDREVRPIFGARYIGHVTSDEITGLLGKIVKRAIEDDGRGVTANRVYSTIFKPFFPWCVGTKRLTKSPLPSRGQLLADGALVKERKGERFLADEEITWFWQACDAESGVFGPFYKLALLTGQRRSELAGMNDSEINRDKRQWSIPGNRTKNHCSHIVHLSDFALDVLDSVPRISNPSGFIFCTNGQTHISGYSRAKARIAENMQRIAGETDIPNWTPHDLRRTFVTTMNETLEIHPHIVEAAVNHVSAEAKKGVAGTYNRATYMKKRRAALEAWGQHVRSLTEGAPSNVVAIRA